MNHGTSEPLGHVAHPQAHAREQIVKAETAGADHFRERGSISAVRARLILPDRAGRGVEGDRRALAGIDQSQAARERLPAARERILPRCIQNDDLHAAGQRGQRLHEVGDSDGLKRNVDVAGDVGVDRDEIILAGVLQTVTGKIDERDGVGSGRGDLADELAK